MDIHRTPQDLEQQAKCGNWNSGADGGRAGASTAASSTAAKIAGPETAAKGAVTETVGRWAGTPNAGSSTHD